MMKVAIVTALVFNIYISRLVSYKHNSTLAVCEKRRLDVVQMILPVKVRGDHSNAGWIRKGERPELVVGQLTVIGCTASGLEGQ